jgi:hypothetical protein
MPGGAEMVKGTRAWESNLMTIEDRCPRIVCDIGIQTKEIVCEEPMQSTIRKLVDS